MTTACHKGEVLVVEVSVAIADRYEWTGDAKPYREFVLPMHVANRCDRPRILAPNGTELDSPASKAT